MYKIFLVCLSLAFFIKSEAQIKALTEDGKVVILYDNNTWKYSTDSTELLHANDMDSLAINPTRFSKSAGATFLVKSKRTDVGIYINPKKWSFLPHGENETNPEYKFSLKSGDGLALLISEKTEIGLETMRQVVLINAQKAAIDARITKEEYRIVNNNKVLCLQMRGTIKGIKFVYFGYYYSDKNGTTQFLTYTSEELFNDLQKEFEEFLNGIVIIDK